MSDRTDRDQAVVEFELAEMAFIDAALKAGLTMEDVAELQECIADAYGFDLTQENVH